MKATTQYLNVNEVAAMMATTQYLNVSEVSRLLGVSRATIWRWSREGLFPAPVKLGPATTRWNRVQIETFAGQRAAS